MVTLRYVHCVYSLKLNLQQDKGITCQYTFHIECKYWI